MSQRTKIGGLFVYPSMSREEAEAAMDACSREELEELDGDQARILLAALRGGTSDYDAEGNLEIELPEPTPEAKAREDAAIAGRCRAYLGGIVL